MIEIGPNINENPPNKIHKIIHIQRMYIECIEFYVSGKIVPEEFLLFTKYLPLLYD